MSGAMDRARVAELIVTCVQGRRRGSGYRVTRDAVLTAAHVVEDAVSVEVRFEPDLPGQWVSTTVSWWADARSDVALLLISPRAEAEVVPVVEFGRLGDSPAVLDVQAVGFPRWKLRVDPASTDGEHVRYRDAYHAVGSVATLSNWREGTLEVALAFTPAAEPDSSPWEGMSGAALWAGNRIVGVISKHHPGDGPSTLAACRLDRALEVADPPVQSALCNLLGLPEQAAQLPCVVPALTGHDAVEPVEVCPYPTDMAAFRPEQAEWFFGREELTSQLVARLDHGLLHGSSPLIVVAPSGAGKSSLLQAGLLPKLDQAVLPGSRSWPRLLLTPTHQPMTAIVTTLAALISDEPTTVAAQLAEDPDRFVERLHRVLHARTETAEATRPRLMLIVDQLEELFTLCTDKRERQRFLELISQLAGTTPNGHEPVALVVYGLRADFYARCADHPQLRAALQDNQMVVGPMSQDELRDAISKPAEHAGLDIETNLVEVMLRDLGAGSRAEIGSDGGYEAGRLPLLAHALRATWRERHGNTLTLTGYQTTGGIQKAVETTADGVYAKLNGGEQRTARTLFLRLVKIGGDDADDTRRRVPRAELLNDTTDTQRAHTVLDAFTQARLLTQYQDTVEITHEALLRAWPTLRRWIETGRSAHLIRQDLDDAAQVWHRHGRSTAALFRGSRLKEAREGINEGDLSPLGVEFLEASVQHEHRVAQRRRRTILGGWSLASIVGLLAVFLGIQLAISQSERDNALFQQITAQANQLRTQNPSTAAQLDLTAHQMRPKDPAVNTNLLGTQNTPLDNPLPGIGDARSVALSADGNTLVTASNSGRGARLWDVSDPARPSQPRGTPLPNVGDVRSVALSADGNTLVTASNSGSGVQLWDVSDGTRPPQPLGQPLPGTQVAHSVALSADGNIVATSSGILSGSGVQLWDVSDGTRPPQPLGQPLPGTQAAYSVALSGDGNTVATSSGTMGSGVQLWDVSDGTRPPQPRGQPLPDSQEMDSVALSADGNTLATASNSGHGARLWDVSVPARPPQPRGQPLSDGQSIVSVALSADGNTLATSRLDDGMRLWNIPSRLRMRSNMQSVALSADGRILATNGSDGRVRLWDVFDPTRPPQPRGTPLSNAGYVSSMALSADGRTLATNGSGSGGTVRLWDVSDPTRPPQPRGTPLSNAGSASSMALSADGRTLATSGTKVRLWDVSDPTRPPQPRGQPLPDSLEMDSVALSADGNTLATTGVSGDDGVRLWDVSDGTRPPQPRGQALPDSKGVGSVALSAGGNAVATTGGSSGSGVRLWDVSDPAHPYRRGEPLPDTQSAVQVALSADGNTLVTEGLEFRVWNQQHAMHRICATTKNNLGPGEWDQYLPNQPYDPPCKSPSVS